MLPLDIRVHKSTGHVDAPSAAFTLGMMQGVREGAQVGAAH